MALKPIYKIHPAIGIARVGDADPDTHFIGPEVPGQIPGDGRPYKVEGKIRPQAARFRIFEYVDNGKGKYVHSREVTLDEKDVQSIEWTVHVANKKAAFFEFDGLHGDPQFGLPGLRPPVRRNRPLSESDPKKLWLDPGERKLSGTNLKVALRKGTAPKGVEEWWPDPAPSRPAIESLGELRTDEQGRLIVMGGRGDASPVGDAPLHDAFNNDGWFDDVSDGPVEAVIRFKDQKPKGDAAAAWVICGPPDFAPHAQNIVTLYDVLFDVAARQQELPPNEAMEEPQQMRLREIKKVFSKNNNRNLTGYKPSFNDEVLPILQRALDVTFLFFWAQDAHATFNEKGWRALADPKESNEHRKMIFQRLHPPTRAGDGIDRGETMPRLLGDDPYSHRSGAKRLRLTLTPTQYAILEQWSLGKFVGSDKPPEAPATTITPHGLDQAALENCVGGAFYPGIEVGWQIRHPKILAEPFRIKKGAPTQFLGETKVTVEAGHFTRQMAVPWQTDFLQCGTEIHDSLYWGWWPAQRPDHVYPDADSAKKRKGMVGWHRASDPLGRAPWPVGSPDPDGHRSGAIPSFQEMLDNWRKFAFVIRENGLLFEQPDSRPDTVP